jgi:4-diphosphocytidyl-2-C-methyl-D-erythritol kinase
VIRLFAPAKINLSLEVIGKRDDGFHDVRTVLQAIGLADELTFETAGELTLGVEPVGAVPVEGNLVLRAALALQGLVGIGAGAAITLRKRIPVAAGLGGGSSDAAATLLGLRSLWGVPLADEEIYRIASRLGSDVPFFVRGGTAIGSGRGDALEMLPLPVERYAIVVTPAEAADAAKTARLYGMLRADHFSDGAMVNEVVRRIRSRESIDGAMTNTFVRVAFSAYESYEQAGVIFGATEAQQTLLAGAGPSLFTLADDEVAADRIAARMTEAGYGTHVATLLGPWPEDGLTEGVFVS